MNMDRFSKTQNLIKFGDLCAAVVRQAALVDYDLDELIEEISLDWRTMQSEAATAEFAESSSDPDETPEHDGPY